MSENTTEINKVEYLKGVIKNGVDLRLKKEAALDAIKYNVDAGSEVLECSTAYLRKVIDLAYLREYDPEKFDKQLGFLDDVCGFFGDDIPTKEFPQE